ncbi:MAG TPA: urea ABC transporter substrate-binding protein, partial [Arcobacter sp.]|nr:urea ABC transporter substrate-binding protein [Arcobacter sp.]
MKKIFILLLFINTFLISQEEVIKIGVLHSQRGTMAISERSLVEAIKMAVDEINKNGGVLNKKIEAIIEDGRSDWPTFAKKAEKLIYQDKVSSVFGCWTSASRKAVLPVFEESNNLLWYPVQYEGGESSPNIIYTGAAPNQQIIPAVKWSIESLGKRFFLIGSDYIFPRKANKIIKKYLIQHGGEVVGEEYIELGEQNFKEVVQMIVEEKPDVIFNTINGDSNQGFFNELHLVNKSNIPVMSVSIAEDELIQLGTEKTKGHYCAWNYFQSINTKENDKFVTSFKNIYGSGRVTDDPIEAAYFQIYLFAKAVEKAKSLQPEEIRKATHGLTFNAPGGLIKIDKENQHTWKKSRIGQIREDGQFKIMWESEGLIKPEPYLEETKTKYIDELQKINFEKEDIKYQLKNKLQQPNVLKKSLESTYSEIRQFSTLEIGNVTDIADETIKILSKTIYDKDLLVAQNSVDSLSKIGYNSKIVLKELINALRHKHVGVRIRVEKAIAKISLGLKEHNDYSYLPTMNDAISVMEKNNLSIEHLGRIKSAYAYLEQYKSNDYQNQLSEIVGNKYFLIPAFFIFWYLFLLLLGTRLFPFYIIKLNTFFETKFKLEYNGFPLTIPLQYIFLVGFFLNNKHVQNAWVEKNIRVASENFKKFGTVKNREVYIPVPVTLNETHHEYMKPTDLRNICSKNRWLIHILGQGGVGKTALACQIGLWAMDDNEPLFSDHKAIPILIEPGVDKQSLSDQNLLKELILGQLQAITNSNEPINKKFFDGLLKKKRLLVIIDDINTIYGDGWNLTSNQNFLISSLIITSRSNESFGNTPADIIKPLDVSGQNLSSFMDAYLTKRDFRPLLTDNQFFKACKQLTEIVGDTDNRQMT